MDLAGPAVKIVVAAVLLLWLLFFQTIKPMAELTVSTGPFLKRSLLADVFIAAFNLIPAFPMDGGRVLRAVLAMRIEYTRATSIAAAIGHGLALLFGLAGLFGNPMFLLIAFFGWMGASQEASMVQIKFALTGIPASRAMLTEFEMLAPTDPLSQAVELILQGSQQDFPVVAEGRLVGVLTRADLSGVLAQELAATDVSTTMLRDYPVAEEGEMLDTLFTRLQEMPVPYCARASRRNPDWIGDLRKYRRIHDDPNGPPGAQAQSPTCLKQGRSGWPWQSLVDFCRW